MKAYSYLDKRNVGDNLAEPILRHFLGEVEMVSENVEGKLVSVGSVMSKVRKGDTVWGTGIIKHGVFIPPRDVKFLAVRGKLTRDLIRAEVPEVYGDPALLLPLMYKPKIPKTRKIGFVPHYVDKAPPDSISVALPWKEFVDEICSCEKIISSSLHGLIIALAYNVPAQWLYSDKVIGQGFKFRDFASSFGVELNNQDFVESIPNLQELQKGLLDALEGVKITQ